MKHFYILLAAFVSNFTTVAVPPPDVAPPKQIERRAVPLPANRLIRPLPVPNPRIDPTTGRPVLPLPSKSSGNVKGENVQLLNGDVFRGKFIGFDPKKGVLWRHPHITPDMQIHPTSVAHVTLAESSFPSTAKKHSCNVELANGDSLSGDLVSMENGKLLLKTWYAGDLTINRTALKSLIPGYTAAKTLFEGPKSSKNWSFVNPNNGIVAGRVPPQGAIPPAILQKRIAANSGNWKFTKDGLECATSGAMVGRNLNDLPDRASIEFDVEWSSYLNLYVNIYTDKLNSYSSCNAYSLRLNQTYAYLYRYSLTRGSQRVGSNIRINLASLKNRASIALKVDKKNRTLALYINGKYTTKWKDVNAEFAGKGKGLLFSSRSTNPMRISQIKVREWNGNLPGQNKISVDNGKEDLVVFSNEDSITGNLIGIKEGQMKFKTSFAELPIPLETVSTINLSKEGIQNTPIQPGFMRINFKGKGRMTTQIKEWKEGKITAVSPTFGENTIDVAALKSVEFNLGKARTTASAKQPSRTTTTSIRIRNRDGVIELNGALGNGAPQVIKQLKLQINGNQLPALPLPRKK